MFQINDSGIGYRLPSLLRVTFLLSTVLLLVTLNFALRLEEGRNASGEEKRRIYQLNRKEVKFYYDSGKTAM